MKIKLKLFVFLVAICLAAVGPAVAAQIDAAKFQRATEAFASGDFEKAIREYESMVQAGQWHPTVFYNLGNAHYRAGNFGPAILNYERVLALEPGHPEARANLSVAQDRARALELRPSFVEQHLFKANRSILTLFTMVSFWVGLFLLTMFLFSRKRTFLVLAGSATMLLAAAVISFCLLQAEKGTRGRDLAIIIGENVEARLATAESANTVLVLPPGSEVRIISVRGEWTYVALPNAQRGWIPAQKVERVRL